jgi:lipoprotein-anchoring transpeptidase ErfK/SrfK
MTHRKTTLSRRQFIKEGLIGAGALALMPFINLTGSASPFRSALTLPDWPDYPTLGRVCMGMVEIKAKPNVESATTKVIYDNAVVGWLREVIGEENLARGKNRRWVETPDGYIYAPDLQKCENIKNQPLTVLPDNPSGKGMWAEVTVPLVNPTLANPPAKSDALKDPNRPFGLYYGEIYWIDDMQTVDGNVQYHVTEKHASYGDTFWADAAGFRQIKEADLKPIHPDVADKKVVVDVGYQTLACYEGKDQVYFCRISSGAKFNSNGDAVDKWSTPVSPYLSVARKYISIHMAGGSRASGYELFGVSWTSIFATGGVAIHATYWHNNYGEPMSHGCVNATSQDSKFVYLWTLPNVPYDAGKIEISGYDGTSVVVIDSSAT